MHRSDAQTALARRYALITLLASGLLTVLAVAWQHHANEASLRTRTAALAQDVVRQVETRMRSYEYGLRGARGAIVSVGADRITRQDFRRYSQTRDIGREFPGARGFGFIRRVPAANETSFLAATRSDGAPGFALRQLSRNDGERFVIQYIEPEDSNAAALGLDIASEANRHAAAVRAVREARAILTAPITLVQALGKPQQSFLLLIPIYQGATPPGSPQARETAALGWAYAPLSTDEILAGLPGQQIDYQLALRDLGPGLAPGQDPVFYTSPAGQGVVQAELGRRVPLTVFGRQWEAEVRPTRAFVTSMGLRSSTEVAIEAGLMTALLTALAWFYGQGVAKGQRQQDEKMRQAAMVEASVDAFLGVSLDGRITSWNPAAESMFGYRSDEALGTLLDELLPPGSHGEAVAPMAERIRQGLPVLTYDTTRHTRDGRAIDVAISVAPLRDGQGRIVGMAKTLRDISAAKNAERALHQLTAELEQKVEDRTASLEAARRDLRNILDALPSMVGYWDRELRNRFANHAYRDWFGERGEALAGQSMQELLGPALFERNRPYVEGALRGEAQTFERSIPRPDGQGERHSLAHYLPDIVDGEVQGFYVLVHDVTELKQSRQVAAAALRDTEFLLDTIHQHAIMSVTDRSGHITDVNDAFCRISGYGRDELLGQTHHKVNSGTHEPAFWPEVWRTIASGVAWRGEVCNRAKDGSLYWVDSIIAPFVSADGRIDRYVSIRFDITERKRASAELRATHERLTLATNAAGMGVWDYDLTDGSLGWDDQMYRLYGHMPNPARAPYELWADSLDPAERAGVEQRLRDCIAGRVDFSLDFAIRRSDGERRYLRAAAQVHRDTEGRALRMIGVNWDVTAAKVAELELRDTTSLLRTVLASASEVSIIATDPDYVIRVFNSGAEKLLGYTSSEVVGQATPALIHDAAELKLRARELGTELGRHVPAASYFREPGAHGAPREWIYRRKDGQTVPVSLVVTGMYDDTGRLLGYLGIAHDVSEQKRYELALLEAKSAAEQANRAKSQFLANMSHEIRTPMNAIIGLSFLLEQTRLDTQQHGLLAKMTRASKTLLGVINDVLDLSKIEAGELGISPEPFNPGELLNYLSDVMQVQASHKGIGLSLQVPEPLPELVVGDSLRVNQILSNLTSNAIKFTAQGGVTVTARPLPAPAGQARLRFEVRDTGIGISPEAASHLFQPFVQADSSITRRFGGTGLGLSIVKQLTELMGGDVGLDSEPGVGSLFWVELPFHLANERAQPPSEADMSTLQKTLTGVRVLVVDDSEINLEVAKRILETVGAKVALAADGEEALSYLREHGADCDVVLMDVHMPNLDGITATRMIRQDLRQHTLPVIALTAGALASQRQEARFAGMNDFIVKPFTPEQIVDCIGRHVRAAPAGRDGLPAPASAKVSDWPAIVGIDTADVARRLGQDQALFRTLLNLLLKEFPSLPLPGQPDAPSLPALCARLHKLRGSAGNVGATDVHASATLAEQACRHGDARQAESHLQRLNRQLAQLAESATPWLQAAAERPAAEAAPLDGGLADELRRLLRQQHVGALDTFEQLADSLRQSLGDARFAELREHIDHLRFSEAAAVLDRSR